MGQPNGANASTVSGKGRAIDLRKLSEWQLGHVSKQMQGLAAMGIYLDFFGNAKGSISKSTGKGGKNIGKNMGGKSKGKGKGVSSPGPNAMPQSPKPIPRWNRGKQVDSQARDRSQSDKEHFINF